MANIQNQQPTRRIWYSKQARSDVEPDQAATARHPRKAPVSPSGIGKQGETDADAIVFVIDDDESVRESLSTLIRSAGLHVKVFVSAEELIRHVTSSHRLSVSTDGVLPRRKLHTVIEYIMENIEGSLTLEQIAAVAHVSPHHFARQFKATTGLPPHQYVIARRVERAQHLLAKHDELGLAEVALRVGFSDQSKFSFHFKRIVGVTPRQFRTSAR